MSTIKDSVRTLFHIRVKRTLPPRGRMPKFGATIVCADVKMSVDTDLTEELWDWLQSMGWREVSHRKDRRQYRFAPKDACIALKNASLSGRDMLHRRILRIAPDRAAVRRKEDAARDSRT